MPQERMPNERHSVTHHFEIAGRIDGYVTVGFYPDGRIGEVGIVLGQKNGDTMRSLVDAVSTAISIGLQHGAPLSAFSDKFLNTRFEPSGWTRTKDVPNAKSILDYIFQWLEKRYPGGKKELEKIPPVVPDESNENDTE